MVRVCHTFAAFAIALVFFIIIRETMPFVNPADNTLIIVAQLQIVLTFLAGFLLSSEAFFIERALLGWALIIIDLGVVVVAVWMQYKYGSASSLVEPGRSGSQLQVRLGVSC